MALTDIARQLKDTFEGFGVAGLQEDVKRFREIYGDAESIRIGEMDYIVINDVYKSKEYADVPESTSPLFFNSINNSYAIIDAETSSTLIDEVYSRVTYMQRVCKIEATPEKGEIKNSLTDLIGESVEVSDVRIKSEETVENKVNIFQCHLIKDTGVSAAPDVYSFMMKHGEIKEISDNVVRQIKRLGEVNLLKDREMLEANKTAIQQSVFDKYMSEDVDIQKVTVKSIFEISMTFLNIHVFLSQNKGTWNGVFNTVYLAGKEHEFDALNANIHVCNACGHELVDVKDPNHINRLHVNMDAYDEEFSTEGKLMNAVGCEDCLEQCPDCGGWHFNYEKFIGTRIYEKVKLVPGREFIKGLRVIEGNYCSCREAIEWVYDEESGTNTEHDIIPIADMAFVNYANEKIGSYKEYKKYYDKEKKGTKIKDALAESAFAKRTLAKFKKYLAGQFDIDSKDIKITSSTKCQRCSICSGEYYRGNVAVNYDDYRCNVCDELVSEKRPMVTRIDGTIFMHRMVNKRHVVSKYVMTKLGNLKHISTHVEQISAKAETQDEETAETEVSDDIFVEEA